MVYRYKYVISRFSHKDEKEYIFTAKDDKKALDKIAKKRMAIGSWLTVVDEKLEKGKLVTKKIKVFEAIENVEIPNSPKIIEIASKKGVPISAMKIGKNGKPIGIETTYE